MRLIREDGSPILCATNQSLDGVVCDYVLYNVTKGGLVITPVPDDETLRNMVFCLRNGLISKFRFSRLDGDDLICVAKLTEDGDVVSRNQGADNP